MKILIIGGGGIGSWLVRRLARLQDHNQLRNASAIVVADDDEVETKNLPYQDFDKEELMDPKALALEIKHTVIGKQERIVSEDQLEGFDIIVCAVDNAKTRDLVYKFCDTHPESYFIDLRAEGTAVWGITSDANWSLEKLTATLGDLDSADKSCQLAYELSSGIIQLGNTIIAEVGAQWILNKLRGKKNPGVFSRRF